MARKKADKIYDYPTRLSQKTGEEVYKEAQRERDRLGRPVPLGEILDRAWSFYMGRPQPPVAPPEPEAISILRRILEDCSDGLRENVEHYAKTAELLYRGEKGQHD